MLLVLMYHRVHAVGGGQAALQRHLRSLASRYPVVLPGQKLAREGLSVCLTFDDATVDFYHLVYPLLHELDLTAVLGVPTAFIEEGSDLDMATRLSLQERHVMGPNYDNSAGALCTWKELEAMQSSGRVLCAAHGHRHNGLADHETDIDEEIDLSARTLERRLNSRPDTFIFPYGSAHRHALKQVGKRFRYAMRIGGAVNKDWGKIGDFIYRVDAEHFWPQGDLWSSQSMMAWRLKRRFNRLRGK